MSTTERTLFLAAPLLLIFATSLHSLSSVQGLVRTEDDKPIVGAVIRIDSLEWRAVSDSVGSFELFLPPASYRLHCIAPGYHPLARTIDLRRESTKLIILELRPSLNFTSDELLVVGQRADDERESGQAVASIDELMAGSAALRLIRRANFAAEASLRGYRAGAVAVTIDGMQIAAACVDHMDPITSYVEPNNLERLEVKRNAGDADNAASVGGGINLVTQGASFDQPLRLTAAAGLASAAGARDLQTSIGYGAGPLALRGSFASRAAGDYRTGDGMTVKNSAYDKYNVKLDAAYRIAPNTTLRAMLLGDVAYDIGYPALLMDTREAQALMSSASCEWRPDIEILRSLKTKLYFNRIRHWMDDDDRSREEIRTRAAMPGMTMPMFGSTQTIGLIEQASLIVSDIALDLKAEYHQLQAFADMRMLPLDENIADMYLINIADMHADNYALAADLRMPLSKTLLLRTNARAELSARRLQHADGRLTLEASADVKAGPRSMSALRGSAALSWLPTDHQSLTATLAFAQGLPTQLEQYGFFLYNVSDGWFYVGNPELDKERAWQAEIAYSLEDERYALKSNLFIHHLQDIISAVQLNDQFRSYANAGEALKYGIELEAQLKIDEVWELRSGFAYLFAHNTSIDDPLPFTPQPEAKLALRFRGETYWLDFSSRLLADQNRVATVQFEEEASKGTVLFGFQARYQINDHLALNGGIENIFDRLYREHLNIGGLLNQGRNAFLRLALVLE